MAGKLVVMVGYVKGFGGFTETHPLLTYLADAEDGAQFSDTVNHRDMRQVRCYYNGYASAMSAFSVGGVHRVVEIDQRGKWPFAKREFHVPVNFEYRIAEAVPEELRFSTDT